MTKIAITAAAFEAITRTLPLGSVGYENKTNERGERLIWLEHAVVAVLGPCAGRARAAAMSSSGWPPTLEATHALAEQGSVG